MDAKKKAKLESAGYTVGDAQQFLGLNQAEAAVVDIKLSLAMAVRELRLRRKWTQTYVASLLDTKQPNVARMERGDATLDTLTKSLVALGADRARLGELVAG